MANIRLVAEQHYDNKLHNEEIAKKLNEVIDVLNALASGKNGGTGIGGAGGQYVEFKLPNGETYKLLHDGTL